MPRDKKCDYCKYMRKDIKKYKTSNKFLDGKKEHESGQAITNTDASVVFYLCGMCYESIVPEEARMTMNKVDGDWYEKNHMWIVFHKQVPHNRIAYKERP